MPTKITKKYDNKPEFMHSPHKKNTLNIKLYCKESK